MEEISKIENKKEYLAAQAELIKGYMLSETTDGTAFQLEHVKFSVKGREILKDITFQIKKGSGYCFSVKMAVEKTTLLRLLARLLQVDAGAYFTEIRPCAWTKGKRKPCLV